MKRRTLIPEATAGVVMPITPMLDMTFQLLFFFILNYHPNALEGQMELALPAPKNAKAQKEPDKPDPSGLDPESAAKYTVLVQTQQGEGGDGRISRIAVQDETGEQPVPLQNGKLDGLRSYLQKMREESGDLQGDITIKGDRRLKWGDVVAVTDACRRAGYKKVGYAAPNDVNNP